MKKMTMAQAMCKVVEEVDAMNNSEIRRVFPLEGSGSKENGYDYLLIGVETSIWYEHEGEEYQSTTVYEVAVHCCEMTGWKPKTEIIKVHENI